MVNTTAFVERESIGDGGLGRRVPTDWRHIERFSLAEVLPDTVDHVEHTLSLPSWARDFYDQGAEGACVGFGSSQMMSILNRRRYDARWLWNQAKLVDEWPDTNPGDDEGTSVRAAMDVLRAAGHVRVLRGHDEPVALGEGIQENRWATEVDEVRTAISKGVPVTIGVNWYEAFDAPGPYKSASDFFVGVNGELGRIRGGHCVCVFAASDRRQAVGFANNWGRFYPRKTWMPYHVLERLLTEDGEAAVVTDRLG